MIQLVEKSESDLSTWLVTMMAQYYQELLAAGMAEDEAHRNLEGNRANLLVSRSGFPVRPRVPLATSSPSGTVTQPSFVG
jgi:hypothetical protein